MADDEGDGVVGTTLAVDGVLSLKRRPPMGGSLHPVSGAESPDPPPDRQTVPRPGHCVLPDLCTVRQLLRRQLPRGGRGVRDLPPGGGGTDRAGGREPEPESLYPEKRYD